MRNNNFNRHVYFSLLFCLLASVTDCNLYAQYIDLPAKYKEKIEKKILTEVEVNSYDTKIPSQSFSLKVYGLHPKSCKFALRKLSLYESYSDFIGFIKKSTYNNTSQMIYFVMSSPLLPYDISLNFQIERVKKPGRYLFTFKKGFLKGLKGTIAVQNHQKKCLLSATADWKGPDTKINDKVFEFFSSTLSKLALEKLIRISTRY